MIGIEIDGSGANPQKLSFENTSSRAAQALRPCGCCRALPDARLADRFSHAFDADSSAEK
ncbi:MAG: hypothetical protein ACLRMJ_00635 [Alistipes finegoldii]